MKGRPASVKYFRVFGSKCFIKINDDSPGKFDSRFDEGIFFGYCSNGSCRFGYCSSKICRFVDLMAKVALIIKIHEVFIIINILLI